MNKKPAQNSAGFSYSQCQQTFIRSSPVSPVPAAGDVWDPTDGCELADPISSTRESSPPTSPETPFDSPTSTTLPMRAVLYHPLPPYRSNRMTNTPATLTTLSIRFGFGLRPLRSPGVRESQLELHAMTDSSDILLDRQESGSALFESDRLRSHHPADL